MNSQLSTIEGGGAEPSRCPLCGGPNDCQLCTTAAYKGPCWCEREEFPEALLQRVSEPLRRRACICRTCVARERRPPPNPGPADFYHDPDTGLVVFTEEYHRRRGYCCGSGCRHCPFAKRGVRGSKGEGSVTTPSVLTIAFLLVLFTPFLATAFEISDDFHTDPLTNGWRLLGDTNFVRWDATNQGLAVAWDSSRSNSFLFLPLPMLLSDTDNFAFSFDLRMADATPRDPTHRPAAIQIAFGLVQQARLPDGYATRLRGTAQDLVEFDWFADSEIPGYGDSPATVSPAIFGEGGARAFSFNNYFDLADGATWSVRCAFTATNGTLAATLLRNGAAAGPVNPVLLPAGFASFAVDAFAVIGWNESATAADSLIAHGTLSQVVLELPDPPIGAVAMPVPGTVQFPSLAGWRYTLVASADLSSWTDVNVLGGTGGPLTLSDPRDGVFTRQFYRVRADRP